jgi:hypothetical protein
MSSRGHGRGLARAALALSLLGGRELAAQPIEPAPATPPVSEAPAANEPAPEARTGLPAPAPAAPRASAGAPTASRADIANELFLRAKEKRRAHDHEAAVPLLEASNDQSERAGTLMLLADSQEKLDRLLSAHETFLRAADAARKEQDVTLEYAANARAAAVEPRIPELEIRFSAPVPDGTLVTLSGVEIARERLNQPVPIDPGHYRLDVRAPNYLPFSAEVELPSQAGQQSGVQVVPVTLVLDPNAPRIVITAGPPVRAALPFPAPQDAGLSRQQQLAWIAGGAGAVAAVGSIVFMLVALDKKRDANEACGVAIRVDDPNACEARGVELRRQAKAAANVATASALISGAALATGLTLFVLTEQGAAPTGATLEYRATF